MKIKFWGTRGSLPAAGPETQVFGGNTPCVSVRSEDTLLVLDAGSGIRRLGLDPQTRHYARVDILLTHLHMDHIQGLGFFSPLFNPNTEIHIWGPGSFSQSLKARLNRYLSPPLFPVLIRDLPSRIAFHELPRGAFQVGPFEIDSCYVCHPGPTVGYRLTENGKVLAYLPDHEPALGWTDFPDDPQWTSGYDLAYRADVLIHDAQFSTEEYPGRIGWGHSTFNHALQFARLVEAKRLLLFHHDPARSDQELWEAYKRAFPDLSMNIQMELAKEGSTIVLE